MAAPRTLVRWGLLAGRKGGRAASSRGCGENRFHRPGLRSSGLPPASLEGYGIWWLGLLARVCSQELRGQSSAPEEEGVRGRALCPAHLPHPSRSHGLPGWGSLCWRQTSCRLGGRGQKLSSFLSLGVQVLL